MAGTTTTNGLITTALKISNIKILSAYSTSQSSLVVIPFVANNTYWYFKVTNNADLSKISNTSVTIVYYYVE